MEKWLSDPRALFSHLFDEMEIEESEVMTEKMPTTSSKTG